MPPRGRGFPLREACETKYNKPSTRLKQGNVSYMYSKWKCLTKEDRAFDRKRCVHTCSTVACRIKERKPTPPTTYNTTCTCGWSLVGGVSPLQIVHLFLGPHADHFAGILLPKSCLEPIVILDVAISVLELIQSRLEHLHCTLCWERTLLNTAMEREVVHVHMMYNPTLLVTPVQLMRSGIGRIASCTLGDC